MTNQPGLVIIGITRSRPDERARELSSSTAVARPFKVIAFEWFEDQMLRHAERELHAKYKQYRVPNREFFELDVTEEQAQQALFEVHNSLTVGKPVDRGSPPAPAAPEGVKSKPARHGMSDTNASVLGLPYWTEFNKMRDAQKLLPHFETAGPRFFHRYFLEPISKLPPAVDPI
jgi:Meiotically up-regulated gene 113